MDEGAATLGRWLATDEVRLAGAAVDTLNVLVIGCKSNRELGELLGPLSKRLRSGLVAACCSTTTTATTDNNNNDTSPPLPSKIRVRTGLPAGSWDLVVLSPRYCEMVSPKELRQALILALANCRISDRTRIVFALPTTPETNPVNIRAQVFGNALLVVQGVPVDESGLLGGGTCSEEHGFQALEQLGFCEMVAQPLFCQANVQKYLKGVPGGIKDLADWLRASVETCRQATPTQVAALRRLCASSSSGEMDIAQPKTVFIIPLPLGFEHDVRAQPNKEAWWPNASEVFSHYGLKHWDTQRAGWERPKPGGGGGGGLVPKLTNEQMNDFVDALVAGHSGDQQRLELPCAMRLTDLLEALVDVWDSED